MTAVGHEFLLAAVFPFLFKKIAAFTFVTHSSDASGSFTSHASDSDHITSLLTLLSESVSQFTRFITVALVQNFVLSFFLLLK